MVGDSTCKLLKRNGKADGHKHICLEIVTICLQRFTFRSFAVLLGKREYHKEKVTNLRPSAALEPALQRIQHEIRRPFSFWRCHFHQDGSTVQEQSTAPTQLSLPPATPNVSKQPFRICQGWPRRPGSHNRLNQTMHSYHCTSTRQTQALSSSAARLGCAAAAELHRTHTWLLWKRVSSHRFSFPLLQSCFLLHQVN